MAQRDAVSVDFNTARALSLSLTLSTSAVLLVCGICFDTHGPTLHTLSRQSPACMRRTRRVHLCACVTVRAACV